MIDIASQFHATCTMVHAAASHLAKEWGDYGYRITNILTSGYGAAAIVICSASDGSRFGFVVDKWGNAYDLDTPEERETLTALAGLAATASIKALEN